MTLQQIATVLLILCSEVCSGKVKSYFKNVILTFMFFAFMFHTYTLRFICLFKLPFGVSVCMFVCFSSLLPRHEAVPCQWCSL